MKVLDILFPELALFAYALRHRDEWKDLAKTFVLSVALSFGLLYFLIVPSALFQSFKLVYFLIILLLPFTFRIFFVKRLQSMRWVSVGVALAGTVAWVAEAFANTSLSPENVLFSQVSIFVYLLIAVYLWRCKLFKFKRWYWFPN
jgi:drug/metabolite transporter (DMT)-like permease